MDVKKDVIEATECDCYSGPVLHINEYSMHAELPITAM